MRGVIQEDDLEVITFFPADLLREMASLFPTDSRRKMIRIDVGRWIHIAFLCDAGIVSRILENLLSNAIKFSPYMPL